MDTETEGLYDKFMTAEFAAGRVVETYTRKEALATMNRHRILVRGAVSGKMEYRHTMASVRVCDDAYIVYSHAAAMRYAESFREG